MLPGSAAELVDNKRRIHEYMTFANPGDAITYGARIYRRDRTDGQKWAIWVSGLCHIPRLPRK